MVGNFHDTYEQRTGNRFDAFPVEGVTFRVRAILDTDKVEYPQVPTRTDADGALAPTRTTVLRYLTDDDVEAPVYDRADLRAGDVVDGPAIVDESLSTTHIGTGQTATVGGYGELVITRRADA